MGHRGHTLEGQGVTWAWAVMAEMEGMVATVDTLASPMGAAVVVWETVEAVVGVWEEGEVVMGEVVMGEVEAFTTPHQQKFDCGLFQST
jgi:hypothetical protein